MIKILRVYYRFGFRDKEIILDAIKKEYNSVEYYAQNILKRSRTFLYNVLSGYKSCSNDLADELCSTLHDSRIKELFNDFS